MSELKVSTLQSNNTLTANSLTVSNVLIINSSGITAPNYTINTSSIAIGNAAANVVLSANITIPSININGTTYTSSSFIETVNTQIFTANGTWTKPSWATDGKELVIVHAWGGGGSGSNLGNYAGGGGAFVFGYFIASQCNATCNVVVGLGGQGPVDVGLPGGKSSFYANTTNSLDAFGGEGGNQTVTGGGNGGGWFANGGPLIGTRGAAGTESTFGGGGGTNSSPGSGGSSIYGGGGGGESANIAPSGSSIYGGGGGGGYLGGNSIFGGAGGKITNGLIPGGGGPQGKYSGARGEVRVYTLRIVS